MKRAEGKDKNLSDDKGDLHTVDNHSLKFSFYLTITSIDDGEREIGEWAIYFQVII